MNRIRRLDAEAAFIQHVADAIRLRHPDAAWMIARCRNGSVGLTDRALEAANERLAAWIAERRDVPVPA